MSPQDISAALSWLGALILGAGVTLLLVAAIIALTNKVGPLPQRILGLWGALLLGLGYLNVRTFPPFVPEAPGWTLAFTMRLLAVGIMSFIVWGAGSRLTRSLRIRWASRSMPGAPSAT